MDEIRTFDPTDRAAYRHWSEERVRFADLDALGHVNNNAIGVYFESGRLEFFRTVGLHEEGTSQATVVARLAMEFLTEIRYPSRLDIGTRPVQVGRSSFTYRQGLFVDGRCVATAETVSVLFNLQTRRSEPLSDEQRSRIAAWL